MTTPRIIHTVAQSSRPTTTAARGTVRFSGSGRAVAAPAQSRSLGQVVVQAGTGGSLPGAPGAQP